MLPRLDMAPAETAPWAELVGRYHVIAVHFPIALLTVGAAFTMAQAFRPSAGRAAAARAFLAIGAIAALLAAGLGWLHAEHVGIGGSAKGALEAHRWWGTSAALFAVASLAFGRAASSSSVARWMHLASVALAATAVAIAGHLGGSLAYGPDYFWPFGGEDEVEAAPQPAGTTGASTMQPPASVPAAPRRVDFASDVRPILEERCYGCHGQKKQKGKLRLDRVAGLFGVREDGPVVAPGDPAASVLFQRVTLPADHDDRMPSEGDPLTPEQIEILRQWIEAGADLGGAADAPPALDPPPDDGALEDAAAPDEGGADADAARALEELRALGAVAGPLSQESDLVAVDFHLLGERVADEHVALLAPLAPRLAELDLSRTAITDAALETVAAFAALEKLDLSSTAVGDEGLARLAPLSKLEVLDLHGTRVGDAGVAALAALPALKRVYVWRTAVTAAGAADLAARRPDVRVVRGEAGE